MRGTQARATTVSKRGSDEAGEVDEFFSILGNHRRRLLIRVVTEAESAERGGGVSVSEASERVGSLEYGKEPGELTSEERKRVYTSMTQNHLPRMEEAGVIVRERDSIEATEAAYEMVRYLRGVDECGRTNRSIPERLGIPVALLPVSAFFVALILLSLIGGVIL